AAAAAAARRYRADLGGAGRPGTDQRHAAQPGAPSPTGVAATPRRQRLPGRGHALPCQQRGPRARGEPYDIRRILTADMREYDLVNNGPRRHAWPTPSATPACAPFWGSSRQGGPRLLLSGCRRPSSNGPVSSSAATGCHSSTWSLGTNGSI